MLRLHRWLASLALTGTVLVLPAGRVAPPVDPPRTATEAFEMLSKSFGAPTKIYIGATRLVFKKSDWDVLFQKLGRTAGDLAYDAFGGVAVHTAVAMSFADDVAWLALDSFRPLDGAVSRFLAHVAPAGQKIPPQEAFRMWARAVNVTDPSGPDPEFAFVPVVAPDLLWAGESIAASFDLWSEIMEHGGATREIPGTGRIDLVARTARCNCNNITATYLAWSGLVMPKLPLSMQICAVGLMRPMSRRAAMKLHALTVD